VSPTPAPPALLDALRRSARSSAEDYVWHLVLHRADEPPRRGERLATLSLAPEDVADIGRREQASIGIVSTDARDCLTVGLRVLGRALEAERLRWVRFTARAGYVDGWGVAVIPERGHRRTVFPGVGLAASTGARVAARPGGSLP
jgi:hypothetical protein